MKKEICINATNVRKEWGGFIDSVIRDKPKIVKRNRDKFFCGNIEMIREFLDAYKFTSEVCKEEDGSFTASLNEIDILVNGKDLVEVKKLLAEELLQYSEDYYNEFSYWHSAPNRKKHLPYITKVILLNDIEDIIENIEVRIRN